MKARGKDRNPKEVVYGALVALPFDLVTLAASQANTVVQARFPLGLDFKVYRVEVVPGGTLASTCSFNVVSGSAAETGAASDDTSDFGGNAAGGGIWTKATAGQAVFASDQALTMTADTVQQFNPTNPEAIFPQGSELTLRTVTAAGTTGNIKVVLYGRFIDTQPTKPMSANPAHTFNVATDL